MAVWRTRNAAVGTRADRRVFSQLFRVLISLRFRLVIEPRVLPNFHRKKKFTDDCFYNSMETLQTRYTSSISFRNLRNEKKKTTCLLWSSKCKFSLIKNKKQTAAINILNLHIFLLGLDVSYFVLSWSERVPFRVETCESFLSVDGCHESVVLITCGNWCAKTELLALRIHSNLPNAMSNNEIVFYNHLSLLK